MFFIKSYYSKGMNKIFFFAMVLQVHLTFAASAADSLTLQECQQLAHENYPNLKNQDLYREVFSLHSERLHTNWLPQVSINGQMSYQSDVFQLPFAPPGMEVAKLPNDRYQATIDIVQPIFDGGVTKSLKLLEKENLSVQIKDMDTELLQIKKTVDETFFSVLLLQKTDSILANTLQLLMEKQKTVQSAFRGGVAANTELLKMETEIIKLRQQITENDLNRKHALQILEILIGKRLNNISLVEPDPIELQEDIGLNRPEILSLTARQEVLHAQQNLLNHNLRPKVSVFASAGFGYPNPYNFYDLDLSPFYVIGAKANWKIWDWQSTAKEAQTLKVQSEIIENNKLNIDRNISIQLHRLRSYVDKYKKLMEHDQELVTAQEKIRKLSSIRFDEGIISSSEFLDDVNAEKLARLNMEVHKVLWIKAGINYNTEKGLPN